MATSHKGILSIRFNTLASEAPPYRTVVKSNRPGSFSTEKRIFTIYHDLQPFLWSSNKSFTNYQLTVYGADVGHLVAKEMPDINDNRNDDFPV